MTKSKKNKKANLNNKINLNKENKKYNPNNKINLNKENKKYNPNNKTNLNKKNKRYNSNNKNKPKLDMTIKSKFINKMKFDLKNYIKKGLKTLNLIERKFFFKKLLKPTPKVKPILKTQFLTKKTFLNFFKKNNLYNIFNLKQDFPYPNLLQTKSEIQRATIFRDLINKEEAYYKTFSKSPLIILLSPKPKNIYLTLYSLPGSARGYKIFWKKTTGMLEKVEGQLSFPALVELFNKLNIFLSKEFLYLQNPIKLIIKSTRYYGTNHLIQNFVKMFEKNMNLNYIYFMYKYRKRFNFFNSYANLINDSVFNYISAIWLKFLKLIRRSKLHPKYIFSVKDLKVFNKFFGIEFDFTRRKYKINHFARLKRLKSLKNKKFIKKSLKLAYNVQ